MKDCPHTETITLSTRYKRTQILRTVRCVRCEYQWVKVIKRTFYGDEKWLRK